MSLGFAYGKARIVRAGLLGAMAAALMGCAANSYALREQGLAAYNQGSYATAAAHFEKSLALNPTDAKVQYLLGDTQLKLGHPLKAELALEQALALEARNSVDMPRLLDDLAAALYQQDKTQKLRTFLQHEVDKRGTVADYLRQGKYLAKIGDMDKARLAFRQAAYYAPPQDDRPYMAIAKFYESINDIPSAKRALRYAYYVKPDDPRIAEQLRRYNIVPGPTVKLKPPKAALLLQD